MRQRGQGARCRCRAAALRPRDSTSLTESAARAAGQPGSRRGPAKSVRRAAAPASSFPWPDAVCSGRPGQFDRRPTPPAPGAAGILQEGFGRARQEAVEIRWDDEQARAAAGMHSCTSWATGRHAASLCRHAGARRAFALHGLQLLPRACWLYHQSVTGRNGRMGKLSCTP